MGGGMLGLSSFVGLVGGCHFMAGIGGWLVGGWWLFPEYILFFFFSSSCSPFYTFLFVFAQKMREEEGVGKTQWKGLSDMVRPMEWGAGHVCLCCVYSWV
jgi:hypothetical protein